jgi:restriction system protein
MPTWEEFVRPVLEVLSDGSVRRRRELHDLTVDRLRLTPEQRAETLTSGQFRSVNRAGWAVTELFKAGALDRPERATYAINDLGRALLARYPSGITRNDLLEIPAYRAYIEASRGSSRSAGSTTDVVSEETELDPIEQIEQGYQRLKVDVATQLLQRLRDLEPAFLEQAVLDVLIKMGYGGTDGQARRIGGTGDGGIDGVIDQDKLGLQRIYVQAKRYAADNTVGREAIQAFVGALHGRNVSQGVFITTSKFSTGAIEYAASVGTRVILIDGARLADLMISYGIGVQPRQTYSVVELDEDYFE